MLSLRKPIGMNRFQFIAAFFLYVLMSGCYAKTDIKTYTQWGITGGGKENIHYSSISQIDTNNVTDLKIAWIYNSEKKDPKRYGPMECNPIIIDSVMYGVSPKLKLFAINATTGKELWNFNPADSMANKTWHRSSVNMNRGVSYWAEGNDKRIIYTVGPIALEVNAVTGKLISNFGLNGGINLANGLGRDSSKLFVAPTSPVMVYKNLFFLSGLVGEETPGHIRAFDVKTGKQKWIFHTIPYPGEAGYETWQDSTAYKYMGSTNSWAGFSLDEKRGILYAPTGNPTNDFYGGSRLGKGLYGNCLLAIDAATGKLIWHFQTVHHDVWDMDLPAAPILITIKHDGKLVDAVAQTTKTGLIFLFDRENGKPLFPVDEIPVNNISPLKNEILFPTQPIPRLPKPLVRQSFTLADLNNIVSDSSYNDIKKRFATYRSGKMFHPPSTEGTIILPGYDGGAEWGGPAFDPETKLLYVNTNEMSWVLNMVEKKPKEKIPKTNLEAGEKTYSKYCMNCHGPERLGGGDYPSIIGVEKKYNAQQFIQLVTTGRRMMPGNNKLSMEEKNALASYILNLKEEQNKPYTAPDLNKSGAPEQLYGFTGYNKFLTAEGYPAIKPPWGSLAAINMNTGEQVWKIPFGEFEELKAKGIPATGRENYGGPVVTAGGLIFIAASSDGKFRAINKRTGKILLEIDLPAPGVATPSVYEVNGKQFVVIACGGSKWGGKSSDAYVAFALQNK